MCWRTFKTFNTFVVGGGNEVLSWKNVYYTTGEDKIVRKCTCICV